MAEPTQLELFNKIPVRERFLRWIMQRECARITRDCIGGLGPFCEDPIIQKYRFTNVNREHDTVTKWIAANVRPKLRDEADAVLQLLVARVLNEPEVLAEVLPFRDAGAFIDTLNERQADGKRIRRGAYMITTNGNEVSIQDYFAEVFRIVQQDYVAGNTSLKSVSDWLCSVHGIGKFLANQVVADLRYTRFFKDAPDWATYVRCGPGTTRGLNRYDGLRAREPRQQDVLLTRLLEIRDDLTDKLPRLITKHFQDPNNLANCFCEFDKYERIVNGEKTTLKMFRPNI